MDVLFTQPYCRIGNLVDASIAKRQTASAHLKGLVDLGILVEVKIGREKLFLHKKFHELLTTDGAKITQYPPVNMFENESLLFPPSTPPTA